MSVAPLHRTGPWTCDDLGQLPDDGCRYEVVDGALLMAPPPTDHHQAVSRRLFRQLDRQATPEWEPVYEVAYTAQDFGLLIEIVSPTSTGMDRVLKPVEYAAAGVPYYRRPTRLSSTCRSSRARSSQGVAWRGMARQVQVDACRALGRRGRGGFAAPLGHPPGGILRPVDQPGLVN